MNTEVERKKEKKLDRTHWMCRIQKYSFGIDAPTFYSGYCPFFWMTWLALLCAPVVMGGKAISFFWDKFEALCSSHMSDDEKKADIAPPVPLRAEPKVKVIKPAKPSDETIRCFAQTIRAYMNQFEPRAISDWYRSAALNSMCSSRDPKYSRVLAWFEANLDNWEAEAEAAEKRLAVEHERWLARRAAREERKKNWNKIACKASVFGRMIARVLLVGLAGVLAFGLFKGGVWVVANLAQSLTFLFGATIVGISVIALARTIKWIARWWSRIDFSWLESKVNAAGPKAEAVGAFFCKGLDGIGWLFGAIAEIGSFLLKTVKLTYKAECPMIIWGDETGPIEKRSK